MNEPKLCPYRRCHAPFSDNVAGDNLPSINGVYQEYFGVCYGEKCAMWRAYITTSWTVQGDVSAPYIEGGCGLAGKP